MKYLNNVAKMIPDGELDLNLLSLLIEIDLRLQMDPWKGLDGLYYLQIKCKDNLDVLVKLQDLTEYFEAECLNFEFAKVA